jgi:hypothetical protein
LATLVVFVCSDKNLRQDDSGLRRRADDVGWSSKSSEGIGGGIGGGSGGGSGGFAVGRVHNKNAAVVTKLRFCSGREEIKTF